MLQAGILSVNNEKADKPTHDVSQRNKLIVKHTGKQWRRHIWDNERDTPPSHSAALYITNCHICQWENCKKDNWGNAPLPSLSFLLSPPIILPSPAANQPRGKQGSGYNLPSGEASATNAFLCILSSKISWLQHFWLFISA